MILAPYDVIVCPGILQPMPDSNMAPIIIRAFCGPEAEREDNYLYAKQDLGRATGQS